MSSFFNMDNPIMRFMSRICDLMILNVLCIIFCIPVITAGASVTALYSVTLKMVKGEESYIFKGFFKAFKENFRQSTIIWLILALAGILLYADYRASALLPENLSNIFRVLIGAVALIYLMLVSYVFAYIARFENTLKNMLKNSLLISILNLPWTILMIAYPAGLVFMTFLTTSTVVYGSMIWIILGFSSVAYLNSIIFRKVFAKYEPQEEEIPDPFHIPNDVSDDDRN